MEATHALDSVRAKLDATFGKALSLMILATASNSTGCMTAQPSHDEFLALVEAVARDDRVIAMWGVAGAADALSDWQRLVL